MIIVRLIEEFPHEINRGLSPNVYYISREQVKQGNQVWIFSFTKDKPSKELKDGITIYRIKKPHKIRWNGGVAFAKAIKKQNIQPDIIHGLNCIPFGWRISKMRKILNCKYAMSLHTSILPLKHGYIKGFKNKLRNLEFTYLAKYLAQKVDLILPISNFIKSELIANNIPKDKIKVVPQGIDFELFNQAAKQKEIKMFPIININLLYIGRFVQMKGLNYLIDACKILNNKNINFTLYLVGGKNDDDDYSNIINKLIILGLKDKINIIPPIPQKEILKYYKLADIFILPSLYEPFGKVILEAQAANVPAIATNAGGVGDVITHNKDGIIVSSKSSKEIANSIIELSRNKIIYSRLAENGISNAKNYDWNLISNQYLDIFQNYGN